MSKSSYSLEYEVNSHSIDKFIFNVDESTSDFIISSFAEWLSAYINSGANFVDGHTLQYGFTTLKCQIQSRVMSLFAPDYKSMPISWIDNLGDTFRLVLAHNYTPETFGFNPCIPTLLNTVVVGDRFDEIPMFINRMSPTESKPNDSGWFFGIESDDVDNNNPDCLRVMSLYEAVLAAPHVLDFLSLPVDCQVVFSSDEKPVILQNYRELTIPKDSYLDLVFKHQYP